MSACLVHHYFTAPSLHCGLAPSTCISQHAWVSHTIANIGFRHRMRLNCLCRAFTTMCYIQSHSRSLLHVLGQPWPGTVSRTTQKWVERRHICMLPPPTPLPTNHIFQFLLQYRILRLHWMGVVLCLPHKIDDCHVGIVYDGVTEHCSWVGSMPASYSRGHTFKSWSV
jgi:hypothetical protein